MTLIYPCQCLIECGEDSYNRCGKTVSGPDEPMCSACLDDGHDLDPAQVPLGDVRRAGTWGLRPFPIDPADEPAPV